MKSYQEHSLRQKDRNNYVSAVIMNKLTIKPYRRSYVSKVWGTYDIKRKLSA